MKLVVFNYDDYLASKAENERLTAAPCSCCFENDFSGFDWVGLEENNER